jgi:hypothetical protein
MRIVETVLCIPMLAPPFFGLTSYITFNLIEWRTGSRVRIRNLDNKVAVSNSSNAFHISVTKFSGTKRKLATSKINYDRGKYTVVQWLKSLASILIL